MPLSVALPGCQLTSLLQCRGCMAIVAAVGSGSDLALGHGCLQKGRTDPRGAGTWESRSESSARPSGLALFVLVCIPPSVTTTSC